MNGFNPTLLGIEIRRLLRNRRTVIFTLVLPVAFFLMFGRTQSDPAARAYVLVSLAVYGAMVATTSGGAMVAVERAQGWTRQLRLTPLHPAAYLATKVCVAMILAAVSVAVALVAGAASGVHLPVRVWLGCALAAWLGSLVFAVFGLAMGYLLPSENVMQILGPVLAALAFLGGLFAPVDTLGPTMATLATFTPAYGVASIARWPLLHTGFTTGAVINVLLWSSLFAVLAAVLFRRDTARA